MPGRPSSARRWLTAATWPVGVTLTSWDYMWRSTVLHRREILETSAEGHLPPAYPDGVDAAEVLGVQDGYGPLVSPPLPNQHSRSLRFRPTSSLRG